MNVASTFAPTNSIRLMLSQRKASYLHPLLEIIKIFAKVYNRKCVCLMFTLVLHCKIEPFIVSFSVCIILDE